MFVVGQECPKVEVPAPNSKPATLFQKEFLQVCVWVCVGVGGGGCMHAGMYISHVSYAGVSLSSVSGECRKPKKDQNGCGTTSVSPVCHL